MLEEAHNHATSSCHRLQARYPTLDWSDPRRAAVHNMEAVAGSAFMAMLFVTQSLAKQAWWDEHFPYFDDDSRGGELSSFLTFTQMSFVVSSLSLYENSLRRLVRAIDPDALGHATRPLKAITNWVHGRLREHPNGWDFAEGDEVVDLFRNVRNTVHNNAAFFSPTGQDEEILWRGHSYQFRHRHLVPFMDWDLHIPLFKATIDLNESIMTHPAVEVLAPVPGPLGD